MCFKIWHSRFALKLTGVFQQVHVKCWSFRTADVNSAGRIVVFFRCLEVKMKNPWKSSVLGRLRYRHSDTVDLYRKRDVFLKLSRNKIHLPSGSEPTTAASATTPKGDWNEFIMQNDDSNLRIFLCIPRCFSKFGHPFWESKVPMMRHFSLGERSLRFLITRWCGIRSPLEISAEFAFAVAPRQRWKQLMCHPVLLNADANGHVFRILHHQSHVPQSSFAVFHGTNLMSDTSLPFSSAVAVPQSSGNSMKDPSKLLTSPLHRNFNIKKL